MISKAHLKSRLRRRDILPKFAFASLTAVWLTLLWSGGLAAGFAQEITPDMGVSKLRVNGRPIDVSLHGVTRVSSMPATVAFTYGPKTQDDRSAVSMRIRFKLEGRDSDWREAPAEMRVILGFLDQNENELSKAEFSASGQSPGWTGNLATSIPQHRQATVVAPPDAHSFWVIITSAGAPEALGVFVVSDLVVRASGSTNNPARELLRLNLDLPGQTPAGWKQDGTRKSMARVVTIGTGSRKKALVIEDNDASRHAQWNTLKHQAPVIAPGEKLVIEWNEMFSIAAGAPATVTYQEPPSGHYRFFLNKLTLMGVPTQDESLLEIQVPLPFWQAPWFWVAVSALILSGFFFSYRFRAWRLLQAENLQLAQQQSLERERLRIAQDIHDDLGARVTQISMASAMAARTAFDAEASKAGFERITQLSRQLVASLHDTIWVVNPENDNLEQMGHYLCQIFNQLLSDAGISCRVEVPALSPDVTISSHQRHNLGMAVKEAVHNIIKHAGASEARMNIRIEDSQLHIFIQDDGHGFDPESAEPGSGLGNLRRRLEDISGSTEVNSRQEGGTMLHLRMPLQRGELARTAGASGSAPSVGKPRHASELQ